MPHDGFVRWSVVFYCYRLRMSLPLYKINESLFLLEPSRNCEEATEGRYGEEIGLI